MRHEIAFLESELERESTQESIDLLTFSTFHVGSSLSECVDLEAKIITLENAVHAKKEELARTQVTHALILSHHKSKYHAM
jgi:hypothetical protein